MAPGHGCCGLLVRVYLPPIHGVAKTLVNAVALTFLVSTANRKGQVIEHYMDDLRVYQDLSQSFWVADHPPRTSHKPVSGRLRFANLTESNAQVDQFVLVFFPLRTDLALRAR